jgi:hypothetical protein
MFASRLIMRFFFFFFFEKIRRSNSYNNSLNQRENYAPVRRIMMAAMSLRSERAKKPVKREADTRLWSPLVGR